MDKSKFPVNSNIQNNKNKEIYLQKKIKFKDFMDFYNIMKTYLNNRPAIIQNVKLPALYVGDIHGYFSNIIIALEIAIKHGVKSVVFLGDYVDRGPYQLKCLIHIMYAYSLNFRKESVKPSYIDDTFYNLIKDGCFNIIALRGNHETVDMNFLYGFSEHLQENLVFEKESEAIISMFYEKYSKEEKIDGQNNNNIKNKVRNNNENNNNSNNSNNTQNDSPFINEKLKMEFLFDMISDLYSLLPFISISSKKTVGLHGGIPKPIHNNNFKETIRLLKNLKTPIDEPIILDVYNQRSFNSIIFKTKREKDIVLRELLGEIIWNDPIRDYIPKPKPRQVTFFQFIKRKLLLGASIIYRLLHSVLRRKQIEENSEEHMETLDDDNSAFIDNIRKTANTELSNSLIYDFDEKSFFTKSIRGGSIKNFSRYAFEEFLKDLKFRRLIRSHEAIPYELLWDDKFITIFSAYPYMGRINTSAFFLEDKDGSGKIILKDYSVVKEIK